MDLAEEQEIEHRHLLVEQETLHQHLHHKEIMVEVLAIALLMVLVVVVEALVLLVNQVILEHQIKVVEDQELFIL